MPLYKPHEPSVAEVMGRPNAGVDSVLESEKSKDLFKGAGKPYHSNRVSNL